MKISEMAEQKVKEQREKDKLDLAVRVKLQIKSCEGGISAANKILAMLDSDDLEGAVKAIPECKVQEYIHCV